MTQTPEERRQARHGGGGGGTDWLWTRIGQFAGSLWQIATGDVAAWYRRTADRYQEWQRTELYGRASQATNDTIQELEELGLGREAAARLRGLADTLPLALRGAAFGTLVIVLKSMLVAPWLRAVASLAQRATNRELRSQPPDLPSLLRILELYPDRPSPSGQDPRRTADLLDQLGFTDADQQLMLDSRRVVPDYTAILTLRNREIINDDQALEYLGQLGYRGNDPERVLRLREWYPSPQDLVTLAGREAFEEDAIERFSLDQDFPPGLAEAAEKAGLSREWIRRFWVAHWTTPSLTQAFEMVRREVTKPDGSKFDLQDLDVYYRLADISPFFGDLLRQIAFIPLGRIDIRRMVRYGVLDRNQARDRYKLLGYSPEDAELQADFAVNEADRVGKNLTKTQVERMYRLGLIDAAELEQRYMALGYDPNETADLRELLEREIHLDNTEERRDRVRWQWERFLIDREEAMKQLAELGVRAEIVNTLLAEWRADAETSQALPTLERVLGWHDNGDIDTAEARRLLLSRRIPPAQVALYLDLDETTAAP